MPSSIGMNGIRYFDSYFLTASLFSSRANSARDITSVFDVACPKNQKVTFHLLLQL